MLYENTARGCMWRAGKNVQLQISSASVLLPVSHCHWLPSLKTPTFSFILPWIHRCDERPKMHCICSSNNYGLDLDSLHVSFKWMVELKEDDSKRIYVNLLVVFLPRGLLGAHVEVGPYVARVSDALIHRRLQTYTHTHTPQGASSVSTPNTGFYTTYIHYIGIYTDPNPYFSHNIIQSIHTSRISFRVQCLSWNISFFKIEYICAWKRSTCVKTLQWTPVATAHAES